ncbi:alpha/beta fold hydrolase [Derxia lacustris]|uniref:alpha/beta fold hydrolase n=1 Tax=Derxia lacustris TaxID=764842 RepID=UPI000A16F96D|nr:alpha/beta hydrolase [Derxia lacustris]
MTAIEQPRFNSVQCLSPVGLHRMAWTEWGDAANPRVALCVHGLTRVGRDFDRLARALAADYRVVCPDIVGRGASGWLAEAPGAAQHYAVPQYVADCISLLARLDAQTVHWVGTSMGGLIGMALAALPGNPIARLVLNDVGAVLPLDALRRIGNYVGLPLRFASFDEGVAYVRSVAAPFGPHSDDEWRELGGNVLARDGEQWRLHYDPRIGEAFRQIASEGEATELPLWAVYDAIRCPTLVLRGADSDLLSAATCAAMAERGPRARTVEFAGIGHAPTLMHADQIAAVRGFLLAD